MATIIDKGYFFQQLQIPNTDSSETVRLVSFIDELEVRLLELLFGYPLLKAIQANNWTLQKYKDIRDGKEYTNRGGNLVRWQGLAFTMGTAKKSLIANYVYYYWQRDVVSFSSGSGEKTGNTTNAIPATPAIKMVRAWNEMVQWNWQLREFLLSNLDSYPEYIDPINISFSINEHWLNRERKNIFKSISIL